MYISIYLPTYLPICVSIYPSIQLSTYIQKYMFLPAHMYTYIYIHMCVYIHVYIDVNILLRMMHRNPLKISRGSAEISAQSRKSATKRCFGRLPPISMLHRLASAYPLRRGIGPKHMRAFLHFVVSNSGKLLEKASLKRDHSM